MVAPKGGNKRRNNNGKKVANKKFNKPNSKNVASGSSGADIFQASQIPDNPGYLDFNDPLQNVLPTNNRNNNVNKRQFKRNVPNNRMGVNNGNNRAFNNNWTNKDNGNRSNNRNNQMHNSMAPPIRMGPRIRVNRGPIRPPIPPPLGMIGGHIPPILPPSFIPNRMGPSPIGPPPIMGPPIPPLGLQRRMPSHRMGLRSGNEIKKSKGMIFKNKNRKNNSGNLSSFASNQVPAKRSSKKPRGSNKKTLKEIISQYSLDKPWVTDEIKEEAKIKEDIENRLKGNKNDKLFAEFKVQRDKFVALYEAAKKDFVENKKKNQKDSKNQTNPNGLDNCEKNANTPAAT